MNEPNQAKDVNDGGSKSQEVNPQIPSFEQFSLNDSVFNEGSFSRATFTNVNMEDAQIRYANLRHMQYIHTDLSGSLVKASNLSDMSVEGNAWGDMQMKQCDVYGLKFHDGTLDGAAFSNSHVVNVTMDNCVIDGLRINGVSIKELIENHPDYRFDGQSIPAKTIYNEKRERI